MQWNKATGQVRLRPLANMDTFFKNLTDGRAGRDPVLNPIWGSGFRGVLLAFKQPGDLS